MAAITTNPAYLIHVTTRKSVSPKKGRIAAMRAVIEKYAFKRAAQRANKAREEAEKWDKIRIYQEAAAAVRTKWTWTLQEFDNHGEYYGDYLVCHVQTADLPTAPVPIYHYDKAAVAYYSTPMPPPGKPYFSRFITTCHDAALDNHASARIDLSSVEATIKKLVFRAHRHCDDPQICLVFESLVTARQAVAAAEEFLRQPAESAYIDRISGLDAAHRAKIVDNRGFDIGSLIVAKRISPLELSSLGSNAYTLELAPIQEHVCKCTNFC